MFRQKVYSNISSTEDGFTLLEIVIAIGLLFIVSSVGVMTFKGFDDRTKEAAVQRAAREVYNAARAKIEDGNSNTKAKDAATEYNDSQSSETANGNRPITVKVIQKSASNPNDIRVEAYYDGGRINASYETPTAEGGSGSGGTGGGGVLLPAIRDTVSKLTYVCDTTTQGYLPVYNISDSATVSMVGNDGSEKLVNYTNPASHISSGYGSLKFYTYGTSGTFNNVSEKLTMKAGVAYSVNVYGTFENLSNVLENGSLSSFNDCLVSVDKWGKQSELSTINHIGGKKFVSVPDYLPSTVTNLVTAFKDTSNFNSANLSKWKTENVTSMTYLFYNGTAFNQNIESWNVSGITNFSYVFYNAKSFNQPLNKWDVSRATTMYSMLNAAMVFDQPLDQWNTSRVSDMRSIFRNARVFNQDLSTWDTSRVTNMYLLFADTKEFNGNISNWDTSKVKNMEGMFYNATAFRGPIAKSGAAWDTSNVTTMKNMFRGATRIYTDISRWDTSKVEDMSGMFQDSAFYHNISGWNVSSVTKWDDFATNAKTLDVYPDQRRIPAKFRTT